MRSSRRLLSFVVASTCIAAGFSRSAHAQDPALETPAPAPIHGHGDHGRALSHLGWAAFGDIASVQIGSVSGTAGGGVSLNEGTVSTPAIGGRWWLSHSGSLDLGIDAGLGFIFTTSTASGTTVAGGTTTTTTTAVPGNSGIFLHVGLPLALFPTEHSVFNIIPEIDIGGAWANGNNNSGGGFTFDVGGRMGPEIHLGFFGVPQFSVQPSVSLFLNVNNYGGSVTATGAAAGKSSSSITTVSFFTAGLGLAFFYYPTLS